MLAALGVFWKKLREWLGPRFSASAVKVATDFRWWIGSVMVILSWLTLSPYFEQQRWPLSAWFSPGPTAEDIASAVVHKLPSIKDEAAQVSTLQSQLADAKNAAQNASQDASACRAQLGEIERQQQTAQSNQFAFPPLPIKKRKLTHSEAVDLIDKLSTFPDALRTLDQPMSQPLIPAPFPNRFAKPAPSELDQKKEMASDISAKLKEFMTVLRQDISGAPSFKVEIENMLGGADWSASSSLNELIQSLENYIQIANQVIARPARPDNELVGYILHDPQAALQRPAQKFNSWRNQVPSRVQELQNEARGDL